METKVFTAPLELKADGQPGEFKAVFATLNVTDLHGDWTIPGAFMDGQEAVIEGWNHDYKLPAGKGILRCDSNEAWVEGQFFLDTEAGRENYQTVKNLGPLSQWSYTFDVLDSSPADPVKYSGANRILKSMDVVGFAPVTRGAGIATRTTMIKSADNGDTQTADDTGGQAETGEPGDGTPSDDVNVRIMLAQIRNIINRMEIE